MTPLHITHHDTGTGLILHVTGELDHTQAPVMRDRVDRLDLRPGQCLTLDLSGLGYCDSSGITALLAARQHALAADADIALAAVPAPLLRILTLVGLDQVFTLRPGSEPSAGAGCGV
ncbi:anti-anti-sigma factor [Streptomyces cyaneogriseus subsp. noncyanogenus]|uniref:Anti-sigma factor antagonist n=1 Tax=Streptomyces cyaneogriseus subsp. noncyanogenus TaxID=477245 RepID=A0A0C5G9C9_9ACTN|nr:STAS domain-containing protein [Streptomyces cyaneogriseus]AJP00676.1 anti-anti-sigma factor [Streptomyces cyaneogriseus subsp. noncyanogenus]